MDERASILSGVDIFSRLTESERSALASYSEVREYPDGSVIFREQGPSTSLFVIRTGRVLIRKTIDGKELDLARYISGEYFGEMEMFENIPRQASAIAEGGAAVLVFPAGGTDFRSILEQYPDSGARILHRLLMLVAGRIRNANRLVSERTPWVEDLRRQLLFDKLTGLYNRTYLKDELNGIVKRAEGYVCLAVMKPDNFKQINDVYGHVAGDGALRLIADTVRSAVRDGIIAVRYRGDEFLLIFPGFDTGKTASYIEILKAAVERLDFSSLSGGVPLSQTFSFGIAGHEDIGQGTEAFVSIAFERMLASKNAGGSRITCPDGKEAAS